MLVVWFVNGLIVEYVLSWFVKVFQILDTQQKRVDGLTLINTRLNSRIKLNMKTYIISVITRRRWRQRWALRRIRAAFRCFMNEIHSITIRFEAIIALYWWAVNSFRFTFSTRFGNLANHRPTLWRKFFNTSRAFAGWARRAKRDTRNVKWILIECLVHPAIK